MTIQTSHNKPIDELRKLAEAKGLYLYQPMGMLDGHKYYLRKMVDGRRTHATVCSSDDLQDISVFLTDDVLPALAHHQESQGGPCCEIMLDEVNPCVLGTGNLAVFADVRGTQ